MLFRSGQDLHFREPGLESPKDGGQHVLGEGGAHSDPDLPGNRKIGMPDLPLHLVQTAQHVLGVAEDDLTVFREGDAVREPVQDDRIELVFELVEPLGEGGLGDVEAEGGLREAGFLRDRLEYSPIPGIRGEPSSPAGSCRAGSSYSQDRAGASRPGPNRYPRPVRETIRRPRTGRLASFYFYI